MFSLFFHSATSVRLTDHTTRSLHCLLPLLLEKSYAVNSCPVINAPSPSLWPPTIPIFSSSSDFTTVVPRGSFAYFREFPTFPRERRCLGLSLILFVEFRRIEMLQHFEKTIEKSSIETLLDMGMHNLFDFLRDSEWFPKIQRFAFSFNDIQNITYNY